MMITTGILLLCLAATSMARVVRDNDHNDREHKRHCPEVTTCDTEECIKTAARIIESLDRSTDPCDNFYQFACGGWLKNQILPPHKVSVVTFNDVDKNLAAARNALTADSPPSELSAVKKARYMYDSCIQYARNPKGTKALVEVVKSEFGSWPKSKDWDDSDFDLVDHLIKASRLLIYPLFELKVEANGGFTENGKVFATHMLAIMGPKFGLPENLYASEGHITVQAYKESIEEEAKRFGYKEKDEYLYLEEALAQSNEEGSGESGDNFVDDIFQVEKALSRLVSEQGEVEPRNYTLEELQDNFGDLLDWSDFLTGLLSTPEVGITDVTSDEIITVAYPSYMGNMTNYFSELPKRTQANYIIWRVIDTLSKVLVKESDQLKSLMRRAIYGVTADPSAEETCVTYVSKAFPLVMHRLLYKDMFPTDEILLMYNLMHEIQQEFNHVINEHDWVDDHTAKLIKKKNAALITTLVSFEQAMNEDLLEEHYANVTYGDGSFVHHDLINRQQTYTQNLRLLRKPFEFSEESLPHEIVAQNNFLENRLEFSSIIFEPPLFSRHIPQSLNYGGMGMVYGHEIVHAFDSAGYMRNEEGAKGEWWSKETIETFKERQQCMIDQYSNFYFDAAGQNVDGNLTLGENIADNGGIKLAYRAYRKFVNARGHEELSLPGLNYSNDQLFFINFAQAWCSIETTAAAEYIVANDVHSPGRFRVLGTAQNSKEFARVFRCPSGSYMNPEEKCEVW